MHRILIVDDDLDMLESMAEILGEEETEIVVARNGEEALEKLRESVFDLVLLDMLMPGMSGIEALPKIKREYSSTQVIMVTAFSTIENAVDAMRKGADDYITKPFKVDELKVTVRRNLEQARFRSCKMLLDMDDTFNSLANPIRRDILLLISREIRIRFMDICRALDIEDHTKVNFHLKVLKDAGLVQQDDKKLYVLSEEGGNVLDCLNTIAGGLSNK